MTEQSSASNTAFFEGVSTNDASARVQRVSSPVASPGHCVLCGKHEHQDGFAYFGLDFEWYGSLYFCADCVGDIANTFGWLHPERVTALIAEHEEVLQENITLGDKVRFLEESVDSLTKYHNISKRDSSPTVTTIVEQISPKSDEQPQLEFDSSTESSIDEQPSDEPDVSEPVSEQGTDDVPSTTGDESTVRTNSTGYLDVLAELDL